MLYVDGNLVVDNNFDQGVTERFDLPTLSAGLHTIEILYRQGGGGWGLGASVQGPDTNGVGQPGPASGFCGQPPGNTSSAPAFPVLATTGATVDVTVNPVNDAPALTAAAANPFASANAAKPLFSAANASTFESG